MPNVGTETLTACKDRVPNDKVRQSVSFALSLSAFDSECRTEIRMKEGLRALSNCLASEEARVQVLLSLIHANDLHLRV